MCAPHWRLVPQPIQNRVYKHYRAKDWTQWGKALDDARNAVAFVLDPAAARIPGAGVAAAEERPR
jgi:hypothetical protein